MREKNLDPENIKPSTFEITQVKREIPDYNGFSFEKQEKIKAISNTIIYTRFLINGIKEINSNFKKADSIVKDFPAFGLMQRAFYFQSMVEMNKLFDENESLCISKFINELINGHGRIIWFNKLSIPDLIGLENVIQENECDFIKVKRIRDKHLAHSDNNRKKETIEIKELITLQELAERVSNKIGNALNGTSTGYNHQEDGNLKGIFSKLTAFDQIRDIVNEANKNIEENISTDKLLQFIRFRNIN